MRSSVPSQSHSIEIVMHRALRRQVLRQRLPLAAGPQHVEDGVQNLAHVHDRASPATLGRRDQRLDQRPLGIGSDHSDSEGRVGRPLGGVRASTSGAPCESSAQKESHPIHPTQHPWDLTWKMLVCMEKKRLRNAMQSQFDTAITNNDRKWLSSLPAVWHSCNMSSF